LRSGFINIANYGQDSRRGTRSHALCTPRRLADVRSAMAREKQIKAWRREKKVALIEW
jgi:predicted GIY-YIG superfamily endonuclease